MGGERGWRLIFDFRILIRGGTILMTTMLGAFTPKFGLWNAGVVVGVIFIGIALVSVFFTEETYGKNLDYTEDV